MAVIEFDHVSKSYQLGQGRTSLREILPQMAGRLLRRAPAENKGLFWALNDVSFKIETGEVVGLIGHNGAGKSTTLKLLSKVTFPASGTIRTQGRMAALIELGAGFHPDLSGRENIYLNGSILGLKRREIDEQFDSMVDFAGLERFIDTPVKRYSSGMYVRLAFAVAAHVKADLLLIDEVLSVGDGAFQQKCLTKMQELRDNGATIVFVSHNMGSINTFCKRVIMLEGGSIVADGKPDEVIHYYRQRQSKLSKELSQKALAASSGDSEEGLVREPVITHVELLSADGQTEKTFSADEQILVRAYYVAPDPIETSVFMLRIHRADGLVCCAWHNWQGKDPYQQHIEGEGMFEALIGPLNLVPGVYSVEALITDSVMPVIYATSPHDILTISGEPLDEFHGIYEPGIEWLPQTMETS